MAMSRCCTAVALMLLVAAAAPASAFAPGAALPLRRSSRTSTCTVSNMVNPNEPRNHPDWDAPVEKMQESGHIVSGTPPPDPKSDFGRNHPDFDAPVEKMLEVGNLRGKGVAGADPDFDFDAPLDKMIASGHIVEGTAPPDVKADFGRNHPDFDAPVEQQIKAGNIKP